MSSGAVVVVAGLVRYDHGVYLGCAGATTIVLVPAGLLGRACQASGHLCRDRLLLAAPSVVYVAAHGGLLSHVRSLSDYRNAEFERTKIQRGVVCRWRRLCGRLPGAGVLERPHVRSARMRCRGSTTYAGAGAAVSSRSASLHFRVRARVTTHRWRESYRSARRHFWINQQVLREPAPRSATRGDRTSGAARGVAGAGAFASAIRAGGSRLACCLAIVVPRSARYRSSASTYDFLERTGVTTSVGRVPEFLIDRTSQLRDVRSPRAAARRDGIKAAAVLPLMDRCTTADDRLLVPVLPPKLFVIADVCRRRAQHADAHYNESPEEQADIVRRLEARSTPVVLLLTDWAAEWEASFPTVVSYVNTRYTAVGEIPIRADRTARILVNHAWAGRGHPDGETGWPCHPQERIE